MHPTPADIQRHISDAIFRDLEQHNLGNMPEGHQAWIIPARALSVIREGIQAAIEEAGE